MLLSRRKVIVGFVGAIVLAAAAVVALDRTDTFDLLPDALDDLLPGDDDQIESGENVAAAFAGGPDQLLYLSGTALELRSIDGQENERVTELPTRDAVASPGSHYVAYVVSEAEADDTQPILHLLNTETGDDEAIGPGISPAWQPNGARVAYLEPDDPSECTTASCPGATTVVAMDPESQEKESLLDAGVWVTIGWAGDYLLVADRNNPNLTTAVSGNADSKTVDVAPREIVSPSPDGRWLLTAAEDGIALVALEDGALAGESKEVDLGGRALIGGSWAHDSSAFAAVVAQPTADEPTPGKFQKAKQSQNQTIADATLTELVVFGPDDLEPRPVEESFGVVADVLWSIEGNSVIFPKVIDPKRELLQAVFCPVETAGECRVLFTWTGGVDLLRMQ